MGLTDATWTNIINAIVTCVLAWIAYKQSQLKGQVTEVQNQVQKVEDKAAVREVKLDDVAKQVEAVHTAVAANRNQL